MMELKYPPLEMPWGKRDIPHAIIEVNQHCNIRCKGCYKNKFIIRKSIAELKKEVDLAISRRNLSSISFAGGEPMLYSELPEIISYVRNKGIRTILVTNGTLLNEKIIKNYKSAGLNRIVLHIDKNQNGRPDISSSKITKESELNNLRKSKVQLCDKYGIDSMLALTLYRDNLDEFQKVIKLAEKLPFSMNSFLITLYSSIVDYNTTESKADLTNKESYGFMRNKEGALPVFYVPSQFNNEELRWLFYHSAITKDKTGKVRKIYFHPKHKGILSFFVKFPRKIKGKYTFDEPRTKKQAYLGLILYSIFSMSPRTFFKVSKFLFHSFKNKNIKMLSFVFQSTPTLKSDGTFDPCKNCPDATVRNGRLMPVCLADRISPIKRK